MKKVLAIILLIVGSLLVSYGITWLAIILTLEIFPFGIIIAAVVAASDALLLEMLRHLFKRRFDLSMPMFLLCAYLPSVFCAVIGWIVFVALKNTDHFTGDFGFLAGLGEFLFAFSYSITAEVLLVFGMIWLAIFTAVEKRCREK